MTTRGTVVGFWNRRKEAPAAPQAKWLHQPRSCGCPDWDVLVLAEAKQATVDTLRAIVSPRSLRWWGDIVDPTPRGRPQR